jgi:hypothetical protein
MRSVGKRIFGIFAGSCFLVMLAATGASAQMLQSTDRAFVGVSFGSQTKARTFTATGSQPLYDETVTFDSSVGIGSSSIIDVSGGVRVWSNFAIGLGFAKYSDTSTGTVSASIPDPLFFDAPHSVSATVANLKHEESQVSVSAYWLQPMTDKIDLAFFAGPTFFGVKQGLATGITVASGTSTIASVTQTQVDESTVGLHAGLDVRYLVTKNVGAGAFVRFTSGSVDAAAVTGGKIDVGGLQYGAGLRFRF